MALSQKHRGKILVPWFCSEEWKMVYNLIYAENSTKDDKHHALNILRTWKIRMPILFAGLEGTLTVLEVLLLDQSTLEETVLCSLFSTAILRFLNICAATNDRQGSFYQTAKKRNLPDWLVNVRHDLAHSQKSPSKFMLTMSLEYCLNWLKSMYWEPQNDAIEDYIVSELEMRLNSEEIIDVYCNSTLAFLNNEDVMKLYSKKFRQLGVYVGKNASFSVIQRGILNLLVVDRSLCENDKIVAGIIDNGNIFLIPHKHKQTGKNKTLSKEMCKAWETLLHFLHERNLLMKLIENFFVLTGNDSVSSDIKLIASIWLNEIFKGLLKKQKDHESMMHQNLDNLAKSDKPNSMQLTTSINFTEHNPNLIRDLKKFKNNVLLMPNVFVNLFLRNLLLIAGCNKNFISDMELGITSLFQVNQDVTINDKLYTIDDVDNLLKDVTLKEIETEVDAQINGNTNGWNGEIISESRWHRIKDTSAFDGYPLGVLPNQFRNKNPIV